MRNFTIRDIENLTGIKAHTLRIWEQRYPFFQPKRKESLHRFYDNEDLKQLLRVSFLYHNGWKISGIASLTEAQIAEEIKNTPVANENSTTFATRLLTAAVDFDETGFHAILNELTAKIGFEKSIVDVGYPYLRKVGLLWSTNNIIPAQEHFSSYIIQNRIIIETEKLQTAPREPQIALLCPQGEFHELPLLFINYLLKKNGWGTVFLGTNVSAREIVPVASLPHISYIYLHLITNFTGMSAGDYLEDICKRFAGKTIVASGQGIVNVQKQFQNLQLLKTDRDIWNFVGKATPLAAHNS